VSNCAIFGCATAIQSGGSLGAEYCATDAATFGIAGTGNVEALVYADQFVSAFNDFRAKASGSLDGAGLRVQSATNDVDIVGRARSTSAPTIGAWEVIPDATPQNRWHHHANFRFQVYG
jgi:hypothetical protein